MTIQITSFREHWAVLSNFWKKEVRLTANGDPYPSVEHAFQASKSPYAHEREMIRAEAAAYKAKQLGRQIHMRDDWDKVKVPIMLKLLRQKFADGREYSLLLSTGQAELIEGNTHGDQEWGAIWDGKKWVGKNLLGRCLMQVRKELADAAGLRSINPEIEGDIVDVVTRNGGILAHQVNCQKVAGGLAGQIRRRWASWYDEYRYTRPILGQTILWKHPLDSTIIVANLYAQNEYGTSRRHTDYAAFEKCLKSLAEQAQTINRQIYIPHGIGCGLGGGDWTIIKPLIAKELPSAIIVRLP